MANNYRYYNHLQFMQLQCKSRHQLLIKEIAQLEYCDRLYTFLWMLVVVCMSWMYEVYLIWVPPVVVMLVLFYVFGMAFPFHSFSAPKYVHSARGYDALMHEAAALCRFDITDALYSGVCVTMQRLDDNMPPIDMDELRVVMQWNDPHAS